MTFRPRDPRDIPVLTDAVGDAPPLDFETAALRAAEAALGLAEKLIQSALSEAHSSVQARVLEALRKDLPSVIAAALHDETAKNPPQGSPEHHG